MVELVKNNSVCTLTFGHGIHNDMPANLLSALKTSIEECAQDPGIKIIILSSKGDKTFCAGAHFGELSAIETEAEGKQFFNGFAGVINAMRSCPQIVVARVQGKAVGGGVGLAAAADYCLALDSASIKLSELAIGIGPFVIGPAVQRKVGLAAFSKLTFSPQTWFEASWALMHGLYDELYDSLALLDQAIQAKAVALSTYNQEALIAVKRMLWSGTEDWPELLPARAAISGRLIVDPQNQKTIKSISSKLK